MLQHPDFIKNGKDKKKKKRKISVEHALSPTKEFNFSSFLTPKKLLIFDLNQVVVFRVRRTSYYEVRPYARDFIKAVSEHFELAVWSSMKKAKARRIISSVFDILFTADAKEPLLFTWFQDKCTQLTHQMCQKWPEVEISTRPILGKDLRKVWECFPQFNCFNTVSPIKITLASVNIL
jgi:hypothetical protein